MEPRVLKLIITVLIAFLFGYGTQHGLTQRTGITIRGVNSSRKEWPIRWRNLDGQRRYRSLLRPPHEHITATLVGV
jgi:hypothetical protein